MSPQGSQVSQVISSYDGYLNFLSSVKLITVDTESGETKGLTGISVAFDGLQDGLYFGINHDYYNVLPEQRTRLANILSDEKKRLAFHNAPYDLKVLEHAGFIPRYRKNFYDTMLMVHWVDENRQNYSLDSQSKAWGGKPKNRTPAMQYQIDTFGWDGVTFEMNKKYSGNDAFITHELLQKVLPEFQAQGFDGELWDVEQDFIWVIANMIELGIKIDLEFCIKEMLKGQHIMGEMRAALGINPGSRKGLEKLLLHQLGLPIVKRTPNGQASFDKDAMAEYDEMLEQVNDERAKQILRYRGWQKTVSSNYQAYISLKDSENVLHPGYKIHGTVTGRPSCERPNLQQIPKTTLKEWNGRLKEAFIARTGYKLWTCDYSQLEFRLTCAYAEQEDLIEIFNDPSRDIFSEMAASMQWLRQNVKTLVYLILFGGGAKRAKIAFGLDDVKQGAKIVNEFHRHYPKIRIVSKQAENYARAKGFISYWTGRRRHFPKGSKYYRAFNSVIQGGEAEIVKRAMIKLDKEVCDENCRMVLQVHDEIVFEIRDGMEETYLPKIIKVMEQVDFNFGVKFKVTASRWGEK